ncbi:hypothetical protein [Bacillus wiedmannii]|uniref:Uncharacterized protein n=1 Tax=Bacillus wiedmannii TaxID=1890302 RepID=A0AB73RD39_9BACI|nr:hypothetical protein [Bacillus wiedmannii]PEK17832.1 hypothetical protein CN694_27495 [Bacillus wiedmannii]
MIRVNDYAEVAFIRFVTKLEETSFCRIEERNVIEEYLLANCKKWDLKFFVKLFQDFLLKNENPNRTMEKIFHEFCYSSDSLIYISPESLDKRPVLNKFLQEFVNSCKNKKGYKEINSFFIDTAIESYKNNTGLDYWFCRIIEKYGHLLHAYFSEFINNTFYYHYYYDFSKWRSKNSLHSNHFTDINNIDSFSFKERRKRLSFIAINSNSFDQNTSVLRDMVYNEQCMKQIDFDFQYIDFLHYLEKKNININKSLTYPILMKYVDLYCAETGERPQKLVKFAKNINKKDNVFKRIVSKMNVRKQGSKFDLERVNIIKAHGLLLFPQHENLAMFLKMYWEDIHYMTGNIMDIYYTEEDFKSNVSGYQRLNKLFSFQNADIILPALFVWEKFGGEIKSINLTKLTHNEIYRVIEEFKINMAKNMEFNKCVENTRSQIKDIIAKKEDNKMEISIQDSKIMSIGDGNKIVYSSK